MKKVWIASLKKWVKLHHRDQMKKRASGGRSFHAPVIPATALPVDSTGNATVSCPMDGNDTLGDCGEAMVAHVDNILTYRQGQGTQSVFDLNALEAQYKAVSGGDNGLDENMVVNQIWKVGIAGNPAAVIVDSLDIDVTNIPLAQFAIDQFYTIELAWSVPDNFLSGFEEGSVWAAAGVPDPNNGHYTPLADVGGATTVLGPTNLNGFYRLWTWGSWCWVSPAFVASVQPQAFVAFSPRQFDPKTGLDSKGRHITTQAAKWVACGGHPIPLSVINQFPPIGTPPPAPVPVNPPPTPVNPPPTPVNPPPVASFPLPQLDAWIAQAGIVTAHNNPRYAGLILSTAKDIVTQVNAFAAAPHRRAEAVLGVSAADILNYAQATGQAAESVLEWIEDNGPAVLSIIKAVLALVPKS